MKSLGQHISVWVSAPEIRFQWFWSGAQARAYFKSSSGNPDGWLKVEITAMDCWVFQLLSTKRVSSISFFLSKFQNSWGEDGWVQLDQLPSPNAVSSGQVHHSAGCTHRKHGQGKQFPDRHGWAEGLVRKINVMIIGVQCIPLTEMQSESWTAEFENIQLLIRQSHCLLWPPFFQIVSISKEWNNRELVSVNLKLLYRKIQIKHVW